MAARENQGLQIALIIFVMLTIVLIVTTFFFFRNYKEEQDKAKDLTTKMAESERKSREADDASREFKSMIGAAESDNKDTVSTTTKKDVEQYGKSLPEGEQNYRALVKHLVEELNNANTRNAEMTAQATGLAQKIAADEAAKNAEIAEYTEKLTQTAKDLEDERQKFNQDRTDINKNKSELSSRFDAKRKEAEEVSRKSSEDIAALTGENSKLTKTLREINEKALRSKKSAEVPDGKVAGVNQVTRMVYINVGSDDGLRRQTSFSVVAQEDSNPAEATRKGKVEVVKLLDRHMAEARIVEDDLSNPIMPGDLIFSPVWEPGRPEHFALAGTMDINGDGTSDRQQIHDLIAMNGGLIDAEVDDDGKRTGQLNLNTKYLVLGEQPKAASGAENDIRAAGFVDIRGEAQTLGVQTIGMHAFLDYMGYKIEDRTVTLGTKAKAADFKARLPDGVQRVVPTGRSVDDIRKTKMPDSKSGR